MSVWGSDEACRKAGCSVFDVSGGHSAQTSNGALSVTDSAYNGARPVESNHQEAETIGSSDEASRSAFDASGGHGTQPVESNRQEVETMARPFWDPAFKRRTVGGDRVCCVSSEEYYLPRAYRVWKEPHDADSKASML
jgi:hypothetical protein